MSWSNIRGRRQVFAGQGGGSYPRTRATPRSYEGMFKARHALELMPDGFEKVSIHAPRAERDLEIAAYISGNLVQITPETTVIPQILNIPSYERGVARVLGYDLPP